MNELPSNKQKWAINLTKFRHFHKFIGIHVQPSLNRSIKYHNISKTQINCKSEHNSALGSCYWRRMYTKFRENNKKKNRAYGMYKHQNLPKRKWNMRKKRLWMAEERWDFLHTVLDFFSMHFRSRTLCALFISHFYLFIIVIFLYFFFSKWNLFELVFLLPLYCSLCQVATILLLSW